MQELTHLDPDRVRASGLTEAEMRSIADTSNKHMMSMVCPSLPDNGYLIHADTSCIARNHISDIHSLGHSEVVRIPARTHIRQEGLGSFCILVVQSTCTLPIEPTSSARSHIILIALAVRSPCLIVEHTMRGYSPLSAQLRLDTRLILSTGWIAVGESCLIK